MHVALIGATGEAGGYILTELTARGHSVTAVVRDTSKVPRSQGVSACSADVYDVDGLAQAIAGHEAVISSIRFIRSDPEKLIAAVKRSGVPRYLVVGGAGALLMPGTQKMVMHLAPFEQYIMVEAEGMLKFLNLLKSESELNWTFLAPSMYFKATGKTGKFRLGKDEALIDAQGESKISFEDYAVAMVDELETPQHVRQRFTVGY